MKNYEILIAETYAKIYHVKAKSKTDAEHKYWNSEEVNFEKEYCVESYINTIEEVEK
tara:strand:+ start:171 stop:341 length:171 start_codon:yes stop_codon:yes gene_type:complete